MNTTPDPSTRRFKFAVNTHGKDKDWDWEILASQYQDRESTIDDVIRHVKSGHALCAGLLGGQRRSKANIIGSESVLLDIDNSASLKDANGKPVLGEDGKAIKVYSHQLTLDEAIAHPFVQQYCALIYTTASHKPDWHKFRLVFLLPRYVEGSEAVEAMVRLLMEHFPHDPACKDASRVFFGSTAATFPHINPNACLPADWLDQAIALANEEKARKQAHLAELAAKREQFRQLANDESWDTDDLIQQALTFIPPRQPGTGNYDECRQVLMALVDHYGPAEGAALAEQWSPSIPGTTWNIDQKVRSFRRSGITIGTLFKIAQDYGFRFPERKVKDHKEPDGAEYEAYLQQEQERKASALAESRERWQLENGVKAAKAAWERSKRFTPTERVREQFVSTTLEDILSADIHALRSTMETGKTQALARILAEWKGGVIAIGSRNSLLLQSCRRWGNFYHLHQDQAHPLIADPNSRIACCLDSLKHFQPANFKGKLIILDEVTSIVKHGLFSGTLSGKRSQALERLGQAVQNGVAVVAWDGSNCDIVSNYLTALRSNNCRVVKQLNEFEGRTLNVEIVRTVSQVFTNEGEAAVKVRLNNHSPVTQKLLETLATYRAVPGLKAKAIVIITDSQRLGEALEAILENKGFKTLRIDSKTTATKAVKQFQPDPNAYLAENQIDALILSPTAESGFDIHIKNYFRHGFAFLFGVIDTDTQMQFLRRARHCIDWTVWCQEYSTLDDFEGTRSPFARRLSKQLQDYLELDAVAALEGTDREALFQQWSKQFWQQCQDDHYQAAIQLQAARNYERSHTRECLEERLRAAGHQVTVTDTESLKETRQLTSEAREAIIMADASSVFHADISGMALSDALRIRSSFAASLDDAWKAEKIFLLHRLPGIENTAEWSVEFVAKVIYRDRKLISLLEAYWMLNHIDAAKQKASKFWQQVMDQGGCNLFDVRSSYTRLRALNHLGLLNLLNGQEYTQHSDELKAINRKCKHSKKLQIALGRSPGKLTSTDWVGRLMKGIGADSSRRKDTNGDRHYTYIPPEQNPTKAAILECLERRFAVLTQKAAETQAEQENPLRHLTPKNLSSSGKGAVDNLPGNQGFDTVSAERTECDEDWLFAPDSLADIRQMWMTAESEEAREIIRLTYPPKVLKRAIS